MRKGLWRTLFPGLVSVLLGLMITAPLSLLYAQGSAGGVRFIEPGQPPVMIHATVRDAAAAHAARGHGGGGGGSNNLYYHGSAGGIGVETAPKIYLVLWGSQWNNNDPSGERPFCSSSTMGSAVAPG